MLFVWWGFFFDISLQFVGNEIIFYLNFCPYMHEFHSEV